MSKGQKYLVNTYYIDLSNVFQALDMEVDMYEKYEKLRDERQLSDYQVAAKSGVSRSTLSEWKTGKHKPNLENMKKLSDFFHVKIEELLE